MIGALPLLIGLALEPPPMDHRGRWSAGLGLRTELAAGGIGPGFQTMFRYRFARHFAFDALGRSTLSWASEAGDPDQLYLALGAGVAWIQNLTPSEWDFRTSLRLTHVHHAPTDSWLDTPGSNVAGDSTGGVQHRSGAEWAVGVLAPRLSRLWGHSLRWEIEAQLSTLPSSDHFVWASGLTVGLLIDSMVTE